VLGRVLAACLVGLVAAGCYNPHVTSGGFSCTATEDPPCPEGLYCVGGLCVDHPADTMNGGDMSVVASDFATGGGTDLASTDLARPGDLAGASDMAQASCGKTGSLCLGGASDCCSGVCIIVCL
jgi:hypothetical protein